MTRVSVVDNGVDHRHPWLSCRISKGRSFDATSTQSVPIARRGDSAHGTVVACVVAAICEDATIVPVRYTGAKPAMQLKAIDWASRNSDIVVCPWNISLGAAHLQNQWASFLDSRAGLRIFVAAAGHDASLLSGDGVTIVGTDSSHRCDLTVDLETLTSEASRLRDGVPIFAHNHDESPRLVSRVLVGGTSCAAAAVAGQVASRMSQQTSSAQCGVRGLLTATEDADWIAVDRT